MADISDRRSFRIISLAEGNPAIGVNHTKPASQIVYANAPVQRWELHKVGENKYRLSINGYPHTGVYQGKVIASIEPTHEVEWEITHHGHHDAYTIALVKDPSLGWTVPISIADSHEIDIGPIISTKSIPPQFLPRQLFYLKRHD